MVSPPASWVTPADAPALPREEPMHNDFTFIAIVIAFFVAAGLLTVACDRIIGPDPVEESFDDEGTQEQAAA
jgi:hypothetical protein